MPTLVIVNNDPDSPNGDRKGYYPFDDQSLALDWAVKRYGGLDGWTFATLSDPPNHFDGDVTAMENANFLRNTIKPPSR